MKALFLLLGLSCGCYLGFYIKSLTSIYIGLLSLIICLFSLFKKQGGYFIVPFSIGLILNIVCLEPSLGKGTFSLFVIQRKENYVICSNFLHRFYVYDKENAFEVGDFLKVDGETKKLLITEYESKFSFKEYLRSYGVRNELDIYSFNYLIKNPIRIKHIEDIFLSYFSGNEKALISSLLFSRKDYENELIKSFSSLTILYLASTSGMLFSFGIKCFRNIASRFANEKTEEILVLVFASILFVFSKSKIGCLRVVLLLFLRFACKKKGYKLNYLEQISIVGLLIALIDFHNVLQVGYIIGFGLSISIFIFRPMIAKYKRISKALLLFCYIRIFLFPFQLSFSNGEYHLFSFIFFYCLYPFILTIYILGIFSLFLFPLITPIKGITSIIKTMLEAFKKTDFCLNFLPISKGEIVIFFIVFSIVLILIDLKEHLIKTTILATYLFSIIFSYIPTIDLISREVSFINVGQGDSIIIRDKNKTVMIDTGGNLSFDMAKDVLIPYLRKKRIYKIDALILTHGDFDHDGAKESLIKQFNVKEVFDKKEQFPYSIGSIRLENFNKYSLEGENESSLALYCEFINKKWLFMGDCPKEVELNIIRDHPDLDCDILKAGHHGSKTSSCAEFLDKVTPSEAIISCGAKNKYGHPNKEVIERLSERGIKIRRTDKEGTISYFEFG